MLMLCRLTQIGILFFVTGFISACVAEEVSQYKKIIEKNILGKNVYSLYDGFGFQKIEIDNEYADLGKHEKYWLAVDSNFEFLTLRTINDLLIEVFIRNPDLKTTRGIYVGASFDKFKKFYPDAIELNRYQNGVKRQMLAYCAATEKLEVEIFEDKVFSMRILNKCR